MVQQQRNREAAGKEFWCERTQNSLIEETNRITAKKHGKDRNGIQIRKAEECHGEMSMTRGGARKREREKDSLLVVSDVAQP